jgi:hypothetical protein
MSSYYEKYLKYKNKYIELKSLDGGSRRHNFRPTGYKKYGEYIPPRDQVNRPADLGYGRRRHEIIHEFIPHLTSKVALARHIRNRIRYDNLTVTEVNGNPDLCELNLNININLEQNAIIKVVRMFFLDENILRHIRVNYRRNNNSVNFTINRHTVNQNLIGGSHQFERIPRNQVYSFADTGYGESAQQSTKKPNNYQPINNDSTLNNFIRNNITQKVIDNVKKGLVVYEANIHKDYPDANIIKIIRSIFLSKNIKGNINVSFLNRNVTIDTLQDEAPLPDEGSLQDDDALHEDA